MEKNSLIVSAEAETKKKKMNNKGVAVVEIILILVILIALVIIFKSQITTLVNNIWSAINKSAESVYN